MKYPKKVQIKPSKARAGKFAIAVWDTLKEPGDVYHAKNAEELLVFLMGVYDWYPEGHDAPVLEPHGGDGLSPTLKKMREDFEAEGEMRKLWRTNRDEYYRRLGICMSPGEDKE